MDSNMHGKYLIGVFLAIVIDSAMMGYPILPFSSQYEKEKISELPKSQPKNTAISSMVIIKPNPRVIKVNCHNVSATEPQTGTTAAFLIDAQLPWFCSGEWS